MTTQLPQFCGSQLEKPVSPAVPRAVKWKLHYWGKGGGRRMRKGRKQIRTPEGIKGTWFLLDASGLQQEGSSQASGSVPVKKPLHWISRHPYLSGCLTYTSLFYLCGQILVHTSKCSSQSRCSDHNALGNKDKGLWARRKQTEAIAPPSGK